MEGVDRGRAEDSTPNPTQPGGGAAEGVGCTSACLAWLFVPSPAWVATMQHAREKRTVEKDCSLPMVVAKVVTSPKRKILQTEDVAIGTLHLRRATRDDEKDCTKLCAR